MKKIKKYIVVLISILFIIAFSTKSVYAVTCELKIKDDGDNNGFIEKDGQLYYVITVSSKTFGGTLASIRFKLNYDEEHLEMVQLGDTELDLGEKGKYTNKPYIYTYEIGRWAITYEEGENVYFGRNIDRDLRLVTIDEEEIDLIKVCFRVRDNVKEKRLVYIDTQDESAEILYAYYNQNTRYITNGVPMKEEIPENPGSDNNQNGSGSDNQGTNNDSSQKDDNDKSYIYGKDENEDNKAPNRLPQAGTGISLALGIGLVVVISVILWIRLRKTRI